MGIENADKAAIARAAQLLRQGRLVAFPTETVYGLGADASNAEAVAGIFAAKGRPADHPLIVHIDDSARLVQWASAVPDIGWILAKHFWPGPLAMILPKQEWVPNAVTGGQATVGLRVPSHPVALALLRRFGGGIAAPSANRYCRISPTTARHVAEELNDSVDLILDGGPCEVGVESTIVDLSGHRPRVLRPGKITKEAIENLLGIDVTVVGRDAAADIRAPGMQEVHYAPVTKTLLCPSERLETALRSLTLQGYHVGLLAYQKRISPSPFIQSVTMPEISVDYAHRLYAALRELDQLALNFIIVEEPPESSEWLAVRDRLLKATVPISDVIAP